MTPRSKIQLVAQWTLPSASWNHVDVDELCTLPREVGLLWNVGRCA